MLRPSGVPIDIVTGKPFAPDNSRAKDKVRERYRQANTRASALTADLYANSEVLRILCEQYAARLQELAIEDPTCMALEKSISQMRDITEARPLLAKREALRILGPHLTEIALKDQNET